MKYPFYTGVAKDRRSSPISLPQSKQSQFEDAKQYLPDSGLIDAVNVALLLRQPLLLTGEPGTGKTQLAYSVAWELGFEAPLKFETKSTCNAGDLFYTYDSLKRFHDAQDRKPSEGAMSYLTYHALGEAILRACPEENVKLFLPPDFHHGGKRRSVVLIDEVDKAPRDFPNDILNELENMYFRIREMGNVVIQAEAGMEPIVIITSNSEKDLPDAFLRRCVFYHIQFPEDDALQKIISGQLGLTNTTGDPFLSDTLSLFRMLRSPDAGLGKRPATSELLGWVKAMRAISDEPNPLTQRGLAKRTLSSLVKRADDLKRSLPLVDDWESNRHSETANQSGTASA